MRYDSADPSWPDRARFVLSAGHASILQYSMLHLTGYDLTLDDLRQFRQWGSRTPGHPEVHHTQGVEVTTGPLGQGFGNSVGMAMAEESLRARFGTDVCDHRIWTIVSDGDLSEGLSHEAASLAGHLGLGRLNLIYDDNHISIDGPTELALGDDAAGRFRAYGWHVVEAGAVSEDTDAIEAALRDAAAVEDRPSIVILRSHIGFPSDKHTDDPAAHGLAFEPEEIAATKAKMGLPPDQSFYVPEEVADAYRAAGRAGSKLREEWEGRIKDALGDRAAEWEASLAGRATGDLASVMPAYEVGKKVATRVAVGDALNAAMPLFPGLVAGGADLTGNTGTLLKGATALSSKDPGGRQIHFGIREHAMGATMNGMALHGGVTPVGGTFLVFSDYMRPSVRLAALMGTKVIFAWSHDSVGVGEDGPTHQPIEQVAALRAIPGLTVIRPADAKETVAAIVAALEGDRPIAMIASRQGLPVLEQTSAEGLRAGGYVLIDTPDAAVSLVATGSEVSVAVAAVELLAQRGIAARVVSLPCWEWFEELSKPDQDAVLGDGIPRLGVEAQTWLGWYRWVDDVVSIDRFGASAPGDVVMRELGITPEHVAERAEALVSSKNGRGGN
jgi:transketolase